MKTPFPLDSRQEKKTLDLLLNIRDEPGRGAFAIHKPLFPLPGLN